MILSDDINGVIFSEDYGPSRPSKYFINGVKVEYKFYCERFDEEYKLLGASSKFKQISTDTSDKPITRVR